MNIDHKKVLNSLNKILENKSIVYEVSSSSTELFGGNNVRIPQAGAHKNQSGWQSANAWDIPAAVGTPVYALANGKAITFNDYGKNIVATQGKKLYGQSFTVESEGGLPDVYYTHLQNSPVNNGTKIQCGQFLGYVMDMPGSDYDHVHIGISSGDISQFLSSDGKLKCGGSITGSQTPTVQSPTKTGIGYIVRPDEIPSLTALTESFGRDVKQTYDSLMIPSNKNSKIYSPVAGVIDNTKYGRNCKNQITIFIDNYGYLRYCGVSKPEPLKNGYKVKKGTLLGKTEDDVEAVLFDKNQSRLKLTDDLFDKPPFGDEEKPPKGDPPDKSKTTYYDPAMALLPSMFFDLFKDKKDTKTGGEEKRWGYATDKKQVDPWIVNAVTKPFKKIGKAIGVKESKKLSENVQRIKNLMK